MEAQILTANAAAESVLDKLTSAADAEVARKMQRYFKGDKMVQLLGVTTPVIRDIEKDLFTDIKGQWSYAVALDFCATLISKEAHETKIVGILMLSRFHRQFETGLWGTVNSWLEKRHFSNWAAVDALATLIVTALFTKFPETLPNLKVWTHSKNIWIRRTAVVALVKLAKKGLYLDEAYDTAETLLDDQEDLLHKAVGWLLKEAGVTDLRRLESFVLKHGSRMSRTTLRYAIEKLPKDKRKAILLQTKPT